MTSMSTYSITFSGRHFILGREEAAALLVSLGIWDATAELVGEYYAQDGSDVCVTLY